MAQFNMTDTKRADGFYIRFEHITTPDTDSDPDDYLFQDEAYREQDQARLDAWHNDEWHFIGTQARAHCMLVHNGVGTCYTLTSPGLWGTESDSDPDYLESIYQEEIATLKADIAVMVNPIYE